MLKRKHSDKGFSLALTLIVITLVFIIGFGIIAIVTSQSRTTTNIMQSTKAYYMARTGVDRAMAELRANVFWSGCGSAASPEAVSLSGFKGSYYVTVLSKSTNATSAIKVWQVTSIGMCDGATRVLDAWITTESFAVYSYFTDYEYGYWPGESTFDGPVHTNGVFTFSGNPQYKSRTTCANVKAYDGAKNKDHKKSKNGVLTAWSLDTATKKYSFTKQWDEGKWFDLTDPSLAHFYCPLNSNNSNFNTWSDGPVALGGSTDYSFKCAQSPINLPISIQGMKEDANIVQDDNNNNKEYYLKIYMDGDICRYEMRANSKTGTLLTAEDAVYPDDATVYVNGKLHILESTIKGKSTIACTNDMYLDGNIKLNDATNDMVGLVSEKNVIVNTPGQDITINASVLAIQGSFQAGNYNFKPKKNMYLKGGNIAKSAGIFGTSDSGYTEHYTFDTRFLNKCPKNFPITGKMKLIGLKDNAALK